MYRWCSLIPAICGRFPGKFPCEIGILGNDCHNNRSFLVFNVLLGAWNPRNPDHSDFPKRKHPLRVFVSTDQNQQWNNNNNNNHNSDNDRDHDNDNDNDNDYDNDNDNDNVNDSDSDNDNFMIMVIIMIIIMMIIMIK